ncbi:hypothetical protein [Paenibacillus sp. S29]|uniref:hypothetical protein n=1 Tax=Paenibacillus sp. S29 TaxID=3394611 RepID=UPI000A848219
MIRSDTYILVKGAAFALLRAHKSMPFAQHALKQLLQHEEFGASAKRELSTSSTSKGESLYLCV